ncbi:putative bifunctional diguanylate cyclase/phosphodiesterase [Phenylobacterium montanum]|uniref:EAL domain-containing protein n=1 Tax=Phenylobacterium montanum TaxID=2823693 RepID=A0A975FVN0_9CAUL|nr:EAL domain-containing protein [Caulobacter sp. S6]QUD86225.1 EAL domain-containing protein [Caulobacter sp. S6]
MPQKRYAAPTQPELFATALRIAGLGAWELDLVSQAMRWSPETYRIFGVDPEAAPARELMRGLFGPEAREDVLRGIERLVQEGTPLDREFEFPSETGPRWIRCQAEAAIEGDRIARITGTLQDVTNQRRHTAQMEDLAFRDPLTGLPNRALFQERFAAAVDRARRLGEKVGLIMLDLDHFKDVNDTLGHDAGDALLLSVADRLVSTFRRTDTVARLGGDEFAVILPGVRGPEDMERPTRLLMELLRNPMQHGGASLTISVSVGAALYPQDDEDAGQLLKNADIAMYKAKDTGRNKIVSFRPEMRSEVEKRIRLLREVRAGIQGDEFTLYYQPLVDIAEPRRVTGLEGLMRWRHPTRGLLLPGAFLAAFEDPECSLALGEVALDSAMKQMREWIDQDVPFGRVAVNLSASQFRTGGIAELIMKKLEHWRVPANRLTVEVTENVYMGWGSESVSDTVRALHQLGVMIALDDFGTGYASLANLKQFPIDRLKIDRSFVQSRDDEPIVKAVLSLGSSLGMKVVAEGVETNDQLQRLEFLGCDQAQGYYFARPMPAQDVAGFLAGFALQAPSSTAAA